MNQKLPAVTERFVFNGETTDIRIVTVDNEPYWFGRDVCLYFCDENYVRTIKTKVSDKYKKRFSVVNSNGRTVEAVFLSKSGVFQLLNKYDIPQDVGVSDLTPLKKQRYEALEAFQEWALDILVRYTSGQLVPTKQPPANYPAALRELADTTERLEEAEKKRKTLQIENGILNSKLKKVCDKVNALFKDGVHTYSLEWAAKIISSAGLGVTGENTLIRELKNHGYLIPNRKGIEPYARYMGVNPLFVIEEREYVDRATGKKTYVYDQTRITHKGIKEITKRLLKSVTIDDVGFNDVINTDADDSDVFIPDNVINLNRPRVDESEPDWDIEELLNNS